MRIWAKYLIIGWSIVSVGIIIVTFQIMKAAFIDEDYEITIAYKTPEKVQATGNTQKEWEIVGETLFHDVFDEISITKKQFIERIQKAKGITIESKHKLNDYKIYIYLPLYAFAVWGVPIVVFTLLGILFSKKKESI